MSNLITRRGILKKAMAASAAIVLPTSMSLKAASEHRVDIKSFQYSIPSLQVRAGDTVIWHNQDIVPHTATAVDHSWDTGLIEPNGQASIVVSEGMNLSYYCEYHPAMVAKLELKS